MLTTITNVNKNKKRIYIRLYLNGVFDDEHKHITIQYII